MPSFMTSAAALVASASLSLAAPANIVPRTTIDIKQIAGPMYFRSGPIQMLSTYDKYARVGAVAPSEVIAAAAAAHTLTQR